VNAGHPAGLVWADGGPIVRLDPTGPMVSPVFSDWRWERLSVEVPSGGRILIYTDGVSDALAGEQDIGDEQMVAAVERQRSGGAPLVDAILADVKTRFGGRPQPDDLTLLTVRTG
jgi:sigma-B regulation protein RsbU (phosphoserine phosphatase)